MHGIEFKNFKKNDMSTSTASRNVITLKGSTDIVTEFFGYSINRYVIYQSTQIFL